MDRKKINQGIIDFYRKKYNKSFSKKYDVANPYDVQEFIFDISDKIEKRCERKGEWSESFTVYPEDNLEEIFKQLGYNDIVFTYKKLDRLDFDGDWDKINHIFSFKEYNDCANSPLSFVSYLGCHCDPIDIIQFIYNTILLYENIFEYDDYRKSHPEEYSENL